MQTEVCFVTGGFSPLVAKSWGGTRTINPPAYRPRTPLASSTFSGVGRKLRSPDVTAQLTGTPSLVGAARTEYLRGNQQGCLPYRYRSSLADSFTEARWTNAMERKRTQMVET